MNIDPDATVAPNIDASFQRLGMARRKKPNANKIKPRSGFYSMPEANWTPETVDATVHNTFLDYDHNRDILGLFVALIAGLASGLVLLSVALGTWATPAEMMTWTLLAMVLSAGLVAGVVLPHDDLRVDGLRRAFIPMGIAVTATLAAGLAWQLSPVRSNLREFASLSPEMARDVIDDKSATVATQECVRVAAKYEFEAWREILVDKLVDRRELTDRCLSELSSDSARNVTAALAKRWEEETLDAATNTDRACAAAQAIAVLDRPPGEVEARLLSCSLAAPTEAVQSCCGEVLITRAAGSDEWMGKVLGLQDYSADAETAAGLLGLAFHRDGVTEAQKRMAEGAHFDGPVAQTTALTLACGALESDAAGLPKHFTASLGSGCQVDVTALPKSRELWVDGCADALELIESGTAPQAALCSAARSAVVHFAVDAASRIVVNAAEDRTARAKMAFEIDLEGSTDREPKLRSASERVKKLVKKPKRPDGPNWHPTFKPSW